MKKYLLTVLLTICVFEGYAQEARPFEAKIYNSEFQMFIKMNLYEKNILLPDDGAVLGEMAGYFWTKRDSRKWYILDAELIDDHTAHMSLVNDFGSEDFEAIITYNGDGKYTFKRTEGSTLKIVVKNKFVRIPKEVVFEIENE
ncbi:MAG: hypothetical protein IKX36_12890 [Prevotella sp.]|nr:hypothetical protein [Prevotella sp.]